MVQGDARVYLAPPDTRSVSPTNAKAYWLSKQLIQWTQVDGSGSFKLHHSATAQITAAKEGKVAGADGSITLDCFTGSVPAAAATRFKFIGAGVVLAVKDADAAQLGELHKKRQRHGPLHASSPLGRRLRAALSYGGPRAGQGPPP